jgi:peptidase M23-like protein
MRRLLVFALATLCACAVARSPQAELSVAESEIGGGDLEHGLARMERAYRELAISDPRSWDRLGELAHDVDRDLAFRAFAFAEAWRWPDPEPKNAVPLSLPFTGRWLVTQGNRGAYSHQRLADRFAWDFQAVNERGETVRGRGECADEFCGFGAKVLAPADGVVVRVRDGVPDNRIGVRNEVWAGGNLVVIRHAPSEVSHFCHLKCGSVTVEEGQRVRRGDVIACCGSSGNAAEPHLHYVLRVGETSDHDSIPARFENARIVRRNEESPDDGIPRTGNLVEPAR